MVWRHLRRDFARVLSISNKRAKNKSVHPASMRIHRAVCEALEQRLLLSTYTVTNTGDNGGVDPAVGAGTGTLRQAIVDSNADTAAPNIINFNIAASGVQTISPLTALPTITQSVDIDGTTEGGYAGTPLIFFNGGSAALAPNGLTIAASNSTVQGLDIGNFSGGDGIEISGVSNVTVRADYIGTDPTGTIAATNITGVLIYQGAQNNIIGGISTAARNLISGNISGVVIFGAASGPQTSGNVVEGNFIGTDVTGMLSVSNHNSNVAIYGGAQNNTIGGVTAGAGNLISGSEAYGVRIDGTLSGPQTSGNVVEGNFIGTNALGTGSLQNLDDGVVLDGEAAHNTVGGTTAAARNIISGNGGSGVDIYSALANVVEGNYIGTDVTGTVDLDLGNALDGIIIQNDSEDNTIGGTTAGAGNVVSGTFGGAGIDIKDSGTTGNVVQGNLIGTDANGTAALPNTYGVEIFESATHNTIGGTTAAARNVISGNAQDGVALFLAGTSFNVVEGNYIGVDASGIHPLGNASFGVDISQSSNNTIGGAVPGAGNVISGNGRYGVAIHDVTTQNTVAGNDIGTDPTGTIDLGNGEFGVEIDNGAVDNFIGGTTTASANVIAFNGDGGVGLYSDLTINNPIRFNFIYDNNTGIGIDLNEDGVTPNDPGDADTGADDLQNTPALGAATNTSTATVVTGTFNSTANSTFFLDFYSSNAVNANGTAQARQYVTTFTVTTDSSGNATLNLTLPGILAPGTYLTATATTTSVYPYGDTSELAFPIQVIGLPPPPPPTLLTPSINITADGTYTGLPQPASATVTGTGNAVIGTATLTYYMGNSTSGTELSGPPTTVGTYTVQASFAGNSTYSAATATDTFHITPAPLVITADNKTRPYGAANPPLTVSYNGFVNSEGPSVLTTQPTASTTATPTSAPGTYAITASGASAQNYSITYVAGTLTVTPAPAASKLVFTVQPSNGTAGQTLHEVDVTIEDSNGHVMTGDNATVTLSIASGPGGFTSGSTISVNAVNGVAKFTNLTLDTAGQYTLKASDSADGGISTVSNKFTISCAATCKIVCMQGPAGGTAGSNCGTTSFCIEDAYGNVETANNSTVTLSIHSGPGSFASSSTTSVKAVNGVVKFSNLLLNKSGSYTLCATQGSMSCNTSSFAIAAAAATHMVYSVLPASLSHGKKSTIQVELLDQYGNLCTNNSSTVKISLGSGPSGASLGGTLSEAVINGIATFSLSCSAAGNYTLLAHDSNASMPALTSATVRVS